LRIIVTGFLPVEAKSTGPNSGKSSIGLVLSAEGRDAASVTLAVQ